MKTFRGIRKALAPRWLTEGMGEVLGYSLDLMKDAAIERVRQAHLIRFPQQDRDGTPGPTDALDAMGRDRRMVRGIDETDASYAARLPLWLVDRERAGNPFALLKQLADYCGAASGASFRTVDVAGNWFSRSAAGVETYSLATGNWNWDGDTLTTGDTSRWSRFWVIIYPGTLWSIEPYSWGDDDDEVWGSDPDTESWGSTIRQEHVQTLRAIVDDWKPEGTRCEQIILAFDPASLSPTAPEPDGTWGDWSVVVDDERVPSRISTARYVNGS